MGEWSKKIGEKGEQIAKEFFNLAGWVNAQNNIEIQCINKKNHGSPQKLRKTHGIDHFFSYQSQLIARTLDNIAISDKCTFDFYPSSITSKYRDHHNDLAMALECFRRSPIRQDAIKSFSGLINNSRDVGVLFWISLSEPEDRDIMSQIGRVRNVDSYNYQTIYVVDNKRASFIYNTITYLKNLKPDSQLEFVYQNTGKNNSSADRLTSGNILPVDFINSGILLIKLIHPDNTNTLVISVIDKFDKKNCKRLMGLALNVAQGFANNSLILFADYNPLMHNNQVNEVKSSFVDSRFATSVIVSSFHDDFRNSAINIRQELATSSSQPLINISQLEQDSEFLNIQQENKQILPYGELLRTFLEQSYISPGDLKELLRHRGIFSCNNEKKDTIPILSTTILTPNEFDWLRENQSTKEDNPKVITRTIEIQTEETLLNIIPENIDVSLIANPEFANYKVIGSPEFISVNSNPDCVQIDIFVERIDKQKSWANEKNVFPASLEITKIPETNKILIESTFTAKETKTVIGKLTSSLVKSFKDCGYITQEGKLEKIVFASFTNVNRFKFIFAITENLVSSCLYFVDIVDAKFSLDEEQELPKDIIWMQKNIKTYSLNGDKLHKTLFLKTENQRFINLHGVESRFKFNLKFNKQEILGECVVSIGFPNYDVSQRNTNAEVEIKVKSLNFKNHIIGCNKFEGEQVSFDRTKELAVK